MEIIFCQGRSYVARDSNPCCRLRETTLNFVVMRLLREEYRSLLTPTNWAANRGAVSHCSRRKHACLFRDPQSQWNVALLYSNRHRIQASTKRPIRIYGNDGTSTEVQFIPVHYIEKAWKEEPARPQILAIAASVVNATP